MGTSFLSRRTRLVIASIAFVIGIAAAWFIRDSLLYERTDDARIDGQIMPLSARINGYAQEVNFLEGQMVHAGDVLAVLDQKEYIIAVYQATANLAYAVNTAASLYYSASITVTTAYVDLDSAQSAVKGAQAEVAAAENKLRADVAVLKQVQTNEAQLRLVEVVVAADQQVLLETQKELVQAASHLREARRPRYWRLLQRCGQRQLTRRFCSARRSWKELSSTSATPSFALRLRESLAKDASKLDRT